MDDHCYHSVSSSSVDSYNTSWPNPIEVNHHIGATFSTSLTWQSDPMGDDHWSRYPTAAGLDAWSQALYGQRSSTDLHDFRYSSNPELEAYWASLSTADKIRGTLISILAGGGIGGLLGYLIMY